MNYDYDTQIGMEHDLLAARRDEKRHSPLNLSDFKSIKRFEPLVHDYDNDTAYNTAEINRICVSLTSTTRQLKHLTARQRS